MSSQLSLATLKRLLTATWSDDLLQLIDADRRAKSSSLEPIEFCREFLARTPREAIDPPPLITGDDLVEMGMRPGPRFKSILDKVRDAQLNMTISSRDEALAIATSEWNQ